MSDRNVHNTDAPMAVTIVYDGDCPVCSFYVRMYRLRALAGEVHLVNARAANHPVLDEIRRLRLDLDQGMVVKLGERLYHGAEAMNVMAILGSGNTVFNSLNRVLFRNPRV